MNTLKVALVALALATVGCSDSGTALPGPGGNGTGGTDPMEFESCAEMCSIAPTATTSETQCVTDEFLSRGYDLLSAPVECAAVSGSVAGCNACMDRIAATDSDCAAVALECL